MIAPDGTAVYPWNHGETLTAAALNAAIAQAVAQGSDTSSVSANVLDFGADPTGTNDSSAAFNAAAATTSANGRNKSVYVPPGLYRINNQINLINGQSLFGDGRGSTQLYCDGNFNMAAPAVILLNAGTQLLDVGPEVRGITITMVQNQSATLRSQMVQYPPVIAFQSATCGRLKLLHCRIEGAWNGLTTNGFNAVFYIDDLELGAIHEGLQIGLGADGPRDFCHIHGLHFWNFGLPSAVFDDGNTVAMHVGRCDGLDCTDVSIYMGQIIVDSVNSASTILHITNLKLDGDASSVTFNGGLQHQISNLYSTSGTSRTLAALTINGSMQVEVGNWYSHNSSPCPMFNVVAGELSVTNANIRHYALGTPIGQTSNGNALLKVLNATVWTQAGTYTQPLFVQGGGSSRLRLANIAVDNLGNSNSGTVVNVAADTFGNQLGPMNLPSGWTITLPATVANTQPLFPAGASLSGITVNSGPTIRAGTGVASGTQPSGSLWLRTDGAAGARLYVSAGGGTWAAVAGV